MIVGAGRPDDLVELTAQELFHDEKQLIGSYYGSSDMQRELPRLIALWRSGRLNLEGMVDEVVDLEAINEVATGQREGRTLRTMLRL